MFEIDIGSSPRAVLEPRIALIAAISDYADALAAILDAPKTDVSAEITAFADQADRLARFSNFVAGTDLPSVNAAVASEQGQSLLALIAFANDPRARGAADARRACPCRRAWWRSSIRALASLSAQVTIWGRGAGAQRRRPLWQCPVPDLYPQPREPVSRSARAACRTGVRRPRGRQGWTGPRRAGRRRDRPGRQGAGPGCAMRFAGRLTPAQRRAAARLNIDRITRALGLIASLASPA